MPHCAAFGCSFQSKGNKNSDVSLHSFPSDKKRRAEWERACGRTRLPKNPRLCSRHFCPDDFESFCRPLLLKELTGAEGYKRRLKPTAVPTVFPHKGPKRRRLTSERRAEKRQRQEMLDALLRGCEHPAPPAADCKLEPSDTLEPDTPPVQSVTPFLRVRFTLNATDAATQTDPGTCDAAVQWPADVQYPIAMDHIYAGKRREKRLKESRQSQDARRSFDESSQESEPDPEYSEQRKKDNADQEDEEQKFSFSFSVGDGRYLVDLGSLSEIIVDEECILQLFKSCRECSRECTLRKRVKGLKLVVYQECCFCESRCKWTNLPDDDKDDGYFHINGKESAHGQSTAVSQSSNTS